MPTKPTKKLAQTSEGTRLLHLIGELRIKGVTPQKDEIVGQDEAETDPILDEMADILNRTDLREWKVDPSKKVQSKRPSKRAAKKVKRNG